MRLLKADTWLGGGGRPGAPGGTHRTTASWLRPIMTFENAANGRLQRRRRGDAGETQGRRRGDAGETQGRHRGDVGETWGRRRGDAGEMQGRCRGDAGDT